MRPPIALALAGTFLATASLLSTPAFATDKAAALKLCGQNRNCGVNQDVGGWVDLTITQSDGHIDVVSCPPKGECICTACRTRNGKGGKVDPAQVLRPSSAR